MHKIVVLLTFNHTGNEWFGVVTYSNTLEIWHEICIFMTINSYMYYENHSNIVA